MPIKLNTASGGGVILQGANTASDKTITIPADDGTMIYANSSGNVGIGTSLPAQKLDVNGEALINGVRVGRGGGSVATNTAVGTSALAANTTANTGVAFGYEAGKSITTGNSNVAIGYQALYSATSSLAAVAIGYQAGYSTTTATGSAGNVFIGNVAGYSQTGQDNVYIGGYAGYDAGTGSGNIAIGWRAGTNLSGSIFNIANNNDRLVLGSNNTTNAYVKVAWTVTSDARDKTDVADISYGIDFVKRLRPVTFVWDERANYESGVPDGTKKQSKKQVGFLAQDVIALELQHGAQAKNLLIADDEEDDRLKVTETKFIPALVKAIQEQQAMIEELKAKVAALEAK